jgi:hypothetical protein
VDGVDGVDAVAGWLASPEGRRAAQRWVGRLGLPAHLADDVAQEVLARTVAAAAEGQVPRNPGAWANRLGAFAARDLLRGALRRPRPAGALQDGDDQAGLEATADEVEAVAVAAELASGVRRALAARVGTRPWVGAAALTHLAVAVDGAPVGARCPQPAGGAGPQEAAEWAALWYAGRVGCFPEAGERETPAVRKRRSRAVAEVRAMLGAAAADAGLVAGRG